MKKETSAFGVNYVCDKSDRNYKDAVAYGLVTGHVVL